LRAITRDGTTRDVTKSRRFIQAAPNEKKNAHTNLDVRPMPLYTATAMAQGGRQGGMVHAGDRLFPRMMRFKFAMPKALGGKEDTNAPNPEVLFAAAYASCFESAVGLAASQLHATPLEGLVVKSAVHIAKGVGGLDLAVQLSVQAHCDKVLLQQICDKAHTICPYSRAIKGNVEVFTKIL